MNLSDTLAAKKSNGRDLHLLSIEGRGICGLTALITLKQVLHQYQYRQKLAHLPRPCEIFDLAGGSGTGGLIVIMLFRLEMTINEAIMAYRKLSESVFSKKTLFPNKTTDPSFLEAAAANLIQSSLGVDKIRARETRMLDNGLPKCFVIASAARNLSSPTLFRTYTPPWNPSYNCTIVEAIRATTAEVPFFPSVDIGDEGLKETFIYAGSRLNNPVKAVLDEAKLSFSGQCVTCVLSIGTGAQGIIGFETTSTLNRIKVLEKVTNDGEPISDEVANELSDGDVLYCRLNVGDGLQNISFEDWQSLGDVKTHTENYFKKPDVKQKVDRLIQILNRRSAILSTVEETLWNLSRYLDGLISILPGESWNTVISEFIQTGVEPCKVVTETLNTQCELLQGTLESCTQGKKITELPDGLKGNIQQLLEGLKKAFQDSHGQKEIQGGSVTYINVNIQILLQVFRFQVSIAANTVAQDILKYIQRYESSKKTYALNQNLSKLNIAPYAAYNSSKVSEIESCFKGTRVRLLDDIESWIAGDDTPIYVLDGVAGIGKSTIAKTVAEYAAGINVLGASFFFSRTDGDNNRNTAKTFFPTIAYQLAFYNQDFALHVNKVLLRIPHVVTLPPHEHFSTLVMEPLRAAFAIAGNPVLIVIDALDECEQGGDALLKIFTDSITSFPRLKLFITTRLDYHIRIILDRCHQFKRFHLQDIDKAVVQSDIRLYLDFHLSKKQVRYQLPDIAYDWKPAEEDMKVLVGICGTLFVLASTAVRFILDSKQPDPAGRLSRLLKGVSRQDFSGAKHTTAMDSFYSHILRSAVPDHDPDDWFVCYQMVVGTIIALQYPLNRRALSAFVDHNIQGVLSHLHSLIPPSGPDPTFRIYHQSFPDFVTSPSRCKKRFLIDLPKVHLHLGKRCLTIMNSHLKPNICKLSSTDHFKDNRDRHLTQDLISQELVYASTHWATHLGKATKLDGDAEQFLDHFAHKHLLAWLDVLSVVRRVDIAYSSLDGIRKLLLHPPTKDKSKAIAEIFHDGCRFIALNIEIIKISAGHVFSALAFGPQDTRLYQTYSGSSVINLNVVSGYEKEWNPTISVMLEHTGEVNFVTFSGDGTRLASASDDKTLRLWDGQTGGEITVLQGHSGSVCSMSFSRDATKLASASADRTVRLWDGQTGAECAVLKGHSKQVNSVVFSPDGMKIASGSTDKTVRLWDGYAEIAVLLGHEATVNTVLFSPDGTRLASASNDGTVRLWDAYECSEIAVLRKHSEVVTSVVFSLDGTKLASASEDSTVRLWNGQTGAEISVLEGHSNSVQSVAFSTDDTKLASASADGTVRLWDSETGAGLAVLKGHSRWVKSVIFSSDGTKLASAYNNTVRLWDLKTCTKLADLRGHEHWINSVVFSPDGTRLASASSDLTVRLWDVQTIAKVADLPGHSDIVSSVVFSPDGRALASISNDRTVRLWDSQTCEEITTLAGHLEPVYSVVFSPDGTKLASASKDTTVRIWDRQAGVVIAVLRGHTDEVRSVAFSPDGAKLASASDDLTVRLWDSGETDASEILEGHSSWVNSVEFSPDSTKLASASEDSTVRLWDGKTGVLIAVLRGHTDRVLSMMFSPDGTKLATSSRDGTVGLWEWDNDDDDDDGRNSNVLGTGFAAFTLDGSRLVSMNGEEIFQVDCETGDKLETVMSGMSIENTVRGVRVPVPGLDLWVILVLRKQPSLPGLLLARVDKAKGVLCFASVCWFPPNLRVISVAVSSLFRVAVGCLDGRILLLDINFFLAAEEHRNSDNVK